MSENKESKNGYGVLIGAVSTVVILWTANWVLLWKFGGDSAEKGQFGDMFGSVNALFSGLAFAFLIYTIWLQRRELKNQEVELEITRKSFEHSSKELTKQTNELSETTRLQSEALALQKKQLEIVLEQIKTEREKQLKANFVPKDAVSHSDLEQLPVKIWVTLRNDGAIARRVKVLGNNSLETKDDLYLDFGDLLKLTWHYDKYESIPEELRFEINYLDKEENYRKQSFEVLKDNALRDSGNSFKLIELNNL